MRTAEVAEVLACSPKHVTTLINSGELTAVRVGARFRVHPDDLPAFVRRNRTRDLG